jgi:hypothetical protein
LGSVVPVAPRVQSAPRRVTVMAAAVAAVDMTELIKLPAQTARSVQFSFIIEVS